MLCAVPGCRAARLARSPLCNTHKSAKRRHGHEQQRTVTTRELAPYIKTVRAQIKRNSKNTVWDQLDNLWRLLLEECDTELEALRNRPAVAYHREAKQQLVKLKEAVKWDASGILCDGWERYPILGFDEVPSIEVAVIGPQDAPSLGTGEVAAGPTAAALGNAVAHALGVRARHLPLTSDRLESLLQQGDGAREAQQ